VSVTAALVRKELRAAAPLWLAIVAAMLAGELPGHDLRELELFFYGLGAVALGAASIGNEYHYGTMSQLLTQPVPRARVLASKLGVLAPALLGILALAVGVANQDFLRWMRPADRPLILSLFVLPVVYGFTVAPWLALKTRSTLAGALFSGAIAAMLLIAGDRFGALLVGEAALDAFKMRVLWGGSALLVVWSATSLWRSFMGLEVPDGTRSDVVLALPASSTVTFARRHPVLLLVGKELRLQQLTLVASLIYVGLCIALAGWHFSRGTLANILEVSTAVHLVVVAALAGAFSCAEERVLGTLDWQLLQPLRARTQFAIKAVTTIVLALVLTIGLPAVVYTLIGVPVRELPRPDKSALLIALLLPSSIYISSISTSAVVALCACLPSFMAVFRFVIRLVMGLSYQLYLGMHSRPGGVTVNFYVRPDARLGALVMLGVALLVLAFAYDNYRRVDRSLTRAAWQVGTVGGVFAATVLALAAGGRLLSL
jgi:ABC-type transport system involved in multi-copper enzyme maturation permease subunit